MTMLLQWLVVSPLVVASALYALWSMLSVRPRLRLLKVLDRLIGTTSLSKTLRSRLESSLAGGCSSCESNASAHVSAKSPGATPNAQSPLRRGGS